MAEYTIYQDGGYYDDLTDLNSAIGLAEELLGGVMPGTLTTFTVENEDSYVLASVTNRRITGQFLKQRWGGQKEDAALECGEEEFDATDYILLMTPDDIRGIRDSSETSDRIGQAHVSWNGPHEVTIEESICEFFGVSGILDISDEALSYAKNRLNPQPATVQVVTLLVKVKLSVVPGANVTEFVKNLDYSVISNTVGVLVQKTELTCTE